MNIKDLLEEDNFSCKYQAKTYEGIYSSPCPWCGGEDRFRCCPNQEGGGNWFCQKCKRSGGIIKYLTDFRKMSYAAAHALLGQFPAQTRFTLRERDVTYIDEWTPNPSPEGPPNEWQQQAYKLIKSAEEYLWRPCCVNIRNMLHDRGLNDEIIKRTHLGWLWTDMYYQREDWGLLPELNKDGDPKKLFIPAGLVIPYAREGKILKVKIRRSDPQDKMKYYMLPGSSNLPIILGKGKCAVVLESELDAFLVYQEAGDLVSAISLGSAQNRPDTSTTVILNRAEIILVSLDSDQAGADSYWGWWKSHFPNCKRWPTPFGKDPTEAYQKRLNLRDWIQAGINHREDPGRDFIISEKSSRADVPEGILITEEDSLRDAISKLEALKALAINIKTTGPDPFTDSIKWVQISGKDLPIFLIDIKQFHGEALGALKKLLMGSSIKVFHDAKYQMKFFIEAGLALNKPFFDTMLTAQILNAGEKRKYDLMDLQREYLEDKNSIEGSDQEVSIIKSLTKILVPELRKAGLSQTAELEFDCLMGVAQMEQNGMLLDRDKWSILSTRLENEKKNLENFLFDELGDINLDSPKQLLESLQSKGLKITDTKKETLSPLKDKYPYIEALTQYRRVAKLVQSFTHTIPGHIHPETGRIHSDYIQLGADTGRFSCRNPNLQQIPRERDFRECFIPSPGHKIVVADFSQIELRVVAEISNDKRMIEAYNKGEDLHKLTASLVMDKPISQITKEERQAAKAINFGLIFAMGARSLKKYSRDTYGVNMTLKQAETFRARFFDAYKGLAQWHQKVTRSNSKETRTLLGRRRLWKEQPPLTQLLNTPIQGTAADIFKKALTMLAIELVDTESKIIGTVHDEIILEVPNNDVEEIAKILRNTMERAGSYFLKKLPVKVDVSIGDSWAEK